MRKPRSSRDAALLGVVSGLSPFHSCGVFLLDALYVAALGAFAGMCIAFAAAWKSADPATVGRGVPAEPPLLRPFDHQTLRPSDPPTEMNPSLVSDSFLAALAEVESGANDAAYNEAEGAVGRYQIRPCYLADANEELGEDFALCEMYDPEKAAIVVRAYLTRWGRAFERRTGVEPTVTDLARIHNGGPKGAERACTLPYAARFWEVAAR